MTFFSWSTGWMLSAAGRQYQDHQDPKEHQVGDPRSLVAWNICFNSSFLKRSLLLLQAHLAQTVNRVQVVQMESQEHPGHLDVSSSSPLSVLQITMQKKHQFVAYMLIESFTQKICECKRKPHLNLCLQLLGYKDRMVDEANQVRPCRFLRIKNFRLWKRNTGT